jgi:hypothetical protein
LDVQSLDTSVFLPPPCDGPGPDNIDPAMRLPSRLLFALRLGAAEDAALLSLADEFSAATAAAADTADIDSTTAAEAAEAAVIDFINSNDELFARLADDVTGEGGDEVFKLFMSQSDAPC